jgi:Iron-containing redox enzyme
MELHLFVRQHYHYSKHFTRYLGGSLSNLNEELDRVALIHNLFDEMGYERRHIARGDLSPDDGCDVPGQ